MSVIQDTYITGSATPSRAQLVELIEALAADHFALGPYSLRVGAGCAELDPFAHDQAPPTPIATGLQLDQLADGLLALPPGVDLAVGFARVRRGDQWDLDIYAAAPEDRPYVIASLHSDMARSDLGAALICLAEPQQIAICHDADPELGIDEPSTERLPPSRVWIRAVGRSAPGELEYGGGFFLRWLRPWFVETHVLGTCA